MLESTQSIERYEAVSVVAGEKSSSVKQPAVLHAEFQLLSLLTRHLMVVMSTDS